MDNDNDSLIRRMRACLRVSPSRGNILGIDPDNPYQIMRHEREAKEFDNERLALKAKMLYVHGFASSGDSGTAKTIQKYLPNCRFISPDLPLNPYEAIALLKRIVAEEKIDVVVGTSMGGMFAQKLRGVPKVLVNPSFHVSESMRRRIGTVPFFKRRKDGATEFEVTTELCDDYKYVESG